MKERSQSYYEQLGRWTEDDTIGGPVLRRSAKDVRCPRCRSEPGARCWGPRFCRERLEVVTKQ